MLYGGDISHFQGEPDFATVKAAGLSYIFQKVTQSTNFVDPTFAVNRANAHAQGLTVGLYHFAGGGNPVTEASYFASKVGSPQPGEILALDWEISNPDPVGWCHAFLDQTANLCGVRPVIYVNKSTLASYNWAPVVAGNYGLWLASYDNSTSQIPSGAWPVLAFKQYTDHGSVPGVAGYVDLDVFFGDAASLAAYGYKGAPAPAPQPPAPPAPTPPPPAPAFNVTSWRCQYGDSSQHIQNLQAWGNQNYPAYCNIHPTDPHYGDQTKAFVRNFAHRSGISSADGMNIGPAIAAALARAGFKG